jgi:hypothetical protein
MLHAGYNRIHYVAKQLRVVTVPLIGTVEERELVVPGDKQRNTDLPQPVTTLFIIAPPA